MASKKEAGGSNTRLKQGRKKVISKTHLRTSIGKSPNSRPKNKSLRKNTKKYKGQGTKRK